jgi:Ca2+-transporting ATPase
MITLGTLLAYQYAVHQGWNESITRSMVFTTLISANIILTLVNRSFYYSVFTTIRYKNNLVLLIIGITIIISGMLLFVKPLADFFAFETLSLTQLSISIVIGALSVIWYEGVKWAKRHGTL